MVNIIKVSYKDFVSYMDTLSKSIKTYVVDNNISIRYVCGLPRGGLPIAIHLSHMLNIKYIHDIESVPEMRLNYTLLVDDLVDSGGTLQKFKKMDCVIATLFVKPRRIINPDIYVLESANDNWIVFPWENQENVVDKMYM